MRCRKAHAAGRGRRKADPEDDVGQDDRKGVRMHRGQGLGLEGARGVPPGRRRHAGRGMKTKKGYGMEGGAAGGGKPQIASRPRGAGPYNEYNGTRPDGTYVLKDWASDAWDDFSQGWGCFQRKEDKKWNFVDADGRLLSGEWFDDAKPFGKTDGDPAAVKIDGRWHALYGKRADGTPDLSGKSVDADDMQLFSCGLAAVRWDTLTGHRADCYGYVDASMNSVGPGESPVAVAYSFAREDYGGKWAWVLQESPSAGGHQNLMG